jgi:hypothetical protein
MYSMVSSRRSRIGRSVVLAGIGGLLLAAAWVAVSTDPAWAAPRTTSRPATTSAPGSRPASQPASQPRAVTQAEFMKVLNQSCVRCHRQACASVDALKRSGWLTPGHPETSKTFTIIGKGKGANTYHKLSDADKATVRNFIAQMKS